jgi:RNA polymerase sigma-70 factor, ECF subfamily
MPTYDHLMGPNWHTELYEEFTPKLANYVYYRIGDWERARELVQDVWLKHYKKFKDVMDRGSSIPDEDLTYQAKWLYKTAKNALIDELRKKDVQKGHVALAKLGDDKVPRLADPVVQEEDAACVQQALGALNNKHAEALNLKDVCGYSYPEIADELNMKPGSVGRTLTRARDRFAEKLQELCPDLYLEKTK